MINLFEHKDKEIKEFIEVAITNKDVEMEYIFGINERSAKEILTKDLCVSVLGRINLFLFLITQPG